MTPLIDLPYYWSTLQIHDFLAAIGISVIMLAIIGINTFFGIFIDSKPAGRKTVIGKIRKILEIPLIHWGSLLPCSLLFLWNPKVQATSNVQFPIM
jgi:hypothetical protein